MKPYFLVLHNFIKLRMKKAHTPAVELFSRETRMVFQRGSKVTFGANIVTDGRCVIVVDKDAELIIGERVYMNENSMISCKGKITIGSGCKFGPNVNVFDNNHRISAEYGVSDDHTVGEISIGEGCWLGANVTVLKGAKIGKNCLISANCVVSDEITDGMIVTQNRELTIEPLRRQEQA